MTSLRTSTPDHPTRPGAPASPAHLDPREARLEDLRACVESAAAATNAGLLPRAAAIRDGIPVYDAPALVAEAAHDEAGVTAELIAALADGPGVLVLAGAVAVPEVDAATAEFRAMIAEQRADGAAAGDHFAVPGANDRVWNAAEKLARRAPEVFAAYYAAPALALVARAWLGPGYQVTSQVNQVNPGGAAQSPHRDYHLGLMDTAGAARYPAHVHRLSPALTLQGAVAHGDMPLESGPTTFLPGSQTWSHGYLVADRDDVGDWVAAHRVALPLASGDAVFFNPALIHGAGHNRSRDIHRLANLLQISSAFGRAMESLDRGAMARAVFPALGAMRARGVDDALVAHAVAACAEGYAFPTDLDADPPLHGLAPESPADVLLRAVREGWSAEALDAVLDAGEARRRGIPTGTATRSATTSGSTGPVTTHREESA